MKKIALIAALFLGLVGPAIAQSTSPPLSISGGKGTGSGSGTVTSIATNNGVTGGTITSTGTIGLAAIAADNVLANSTGGSAAPIATSIGSCSAATSALTYNTSTHAFGCNTTTTGTVTSVATGAGLTGGPITATGTISTTYIIRAVTSSPDTILSSDAAKLVTYSNGSAIAVTLPQATGSFAAGFAFAVQNLGVGTVTITPTTSTINGGATLALTTNQGCTIVSDGANWQVSNCTAVGGGSGVPSIAGTTNQINESGSPGATTLSLSSTISLPGTLTNPTNGAASAPSELISGTAFGGTGTTSFPLFYIATAGATAPTTLSTSGTLFGINSANAFGGNLLALYKGGTAEATIDNGGKMTINGEFDPFGRILGNAQIYAGQFSPLGWANGDQMTGGTTTKVIIGGPDSGTPSAQTFANNSGSGTNIAGTLFTIQGSLGTGNASSGGINFDVGGAIAGSGTTAATPTHAITIAGVTGAVAIPLATTGTNADFACLATGNVFTIQASACTISSLRFKKGVERFSGSVLSVVDSLDVDTFFYKAKNSDANANVQQLGLIAEDIAKKLPICAEYEADMKTPKSYKQECLIAVLVKGQQEQQKEIDELWVSVAILFAGLGGSFVYRRRA